ncbi:MULTISPECIES: hypothetical protein [Rhodobacterales]|uniref:hypothetical protein n=1 Tax=Rhodobacterales TaxID=204455 RepID=UPI00215D950E|nr:MULTISPECIES: hypothetical protein [Rhodobacterales]MDO6589303.1 hypothetical protein [Yoonia sp. 1_MG-2023]
MSDDWFAITGWFMGQMIEQNIADIRALLESKLRVRGGSLAVQIRKARRLLPRAVRRDLNYLVETAELSRNPKLVRMVDTARVARAHRNAVAFLDGVDLREQRITGLINVIAAIALAILVTVALVIYVLVQRGYVGPGL